MPPPRIRGSPGVLATLSHREVPDPLSSWRSLIPPGIPNSPSTWGSPPLPACPRGSPRCPQAHERLEERKLEAVRGDNLALVQEILRDIGRLARPDVQGAAAELARILREPHFQVRGTRPGPLLCRGCGTGAGPPVLCQKAWRACGGRCATCVCQACGTQG